MKHNASTKVWDGRRTRLITTICLVLGLQGCTSFQPAEQPRAAMAITAVAAADWPVRKTDQLSEIATERPKEITELVLDGSKRLDDIAPEFRERVQWPLGQVTYSGVHGMGVLRVVESSRSQDAQRSSQRDPRRAGSSGLLRFVSYSPIDDRPADKRLEGWLRRARAASDARFSEQNAGVRANDPEVLAMLYEGTAIRLRPPAKNIDPRGLIVHMAGLGSAEYEQPLLDELSNRGWYVLRISTPRVWWFEERTYPIASRADVPVVAKQLATQIDDLVAEPAYAAEAAIDFLRSQRPDVPLHPMIMVGCSAGALAAPAVVARLQHDFDGAVLVGGGANLLEISQTSDLTTAGIRLSWPDNQPRPQWRRELFAEYLKASKLDPYHTAAALHDKPVLLVHANLDSTVPADNGFLLWQRLNKPDRYVHVFGHMLLFFTLPSQVNRIADWIDHALPASTRNTTAKESTGSGSERESPTASQ